MAGDQIFAVDAVVNGAGQGVAALAPVIDIAEALASMEFPGDSRDRYMLYAEWALDFNADFNARAAAGQSPSETYYEDIDAFAHKRAAVYGFIQRGVVIAGKAYSLQQLEAAVQASTVLYETFAVTDADNGGSSRSISWDSLGLAHNWAAQVLTGDERDAINETCARENGHCPAEQVSDGCGG